MFVFYCKLFPYFILVCTHCPPLAGNVRAAWRSGGLHYRSCGLQKFIFALPFLRAYCRRCAKPPVVRWHICDVFIFNLHCRLLLMLVKFTVRSKVIMSLESDISISRTAFHVSRRRFIFGAAFLSSRQYFNF